MRFRLPDLLESLDHQQGSSRDSSAAHRDHAGQFSQSQVFRAHSKFEWLTAMRAAFHLDRIVRLALSLSSFLYPIPNAGLLLTFHCTLPNSNLSLPERPVSMDFVGRNPFQLRKEDPFCNVKYMAFMVIAYLDQNQFDFKRIRWSESLQRSIGRGSRRFVAR